ncbi:hypothetical protein BM1_03509 [Bipolaris maydis]|nr:hypothetical protein BM1_03509 [Bipolaris maydis]
MPIYQKCTTLKIGYLQGLLGTYTVLKSLHKNFWTARASSSGLEVSPGQRTSNMKNLERSEIKLVAKGILEALNAFHEAGYLHTDVNLDNILVNYGVGTNRFSEVKPSDCGDAYHVDPNADSLEIGHVIGAAIFRSPKANLQLWWGTATDIWSFSATDHEEGPKG